MLPPQQNQVQPTSQPAASRLRSRSGETKGARRSTAPKAACRDEASKDYQCVTHGSQPALGCRNYGFRDRPAAGLCFAAVAAAMKRNYRHRRWNIARFRSYCDFIRRRLAARRPSAGSLPGPGQLLALIRRFMNVELELSMTQMRRCGLFLPRDTDGLRVGDLHYVEQRALLSQTRYLNKRIGSVR